MCVFSDLNSLKIQLSQLLRTYNILILLTWSCEGQLGGPAEDILQLLEPAVQDIYTYTPHPLTLVCVFIVQYVDQFGDTHEDFFQLLEPALAFSSSYLGVCV